MWDSKPYKGKNKLNMSETKSYLLKRQSEWHESGVKGDRGSNKADTNEWVVKMTVKYESNDMKKWAKIKRGLNR